MADHGSAVSSCVAEGGLLRYFLPNDLLLRTAELDQLLGVVDAVAEGLDGVRDCLALGIGLDLAS